MTVKYLHKHEFTVMLSTSFKVRLPYANDITSLCGCVPLSGHSESEEERWRVSVPELWPHSAP